MKTIINILLIVSVLPVIFFMIILLDTLAYLAASDYYMIDIFITVIIFLAIYILFTFLTAIIYKFFYWPFKCNKSN